VIKPTASTFSSLISYPVVTLIRITGAEDPYWKFWGAYRTDEEADADYLKRIRGHGVTVWAWTGRVDKAIKMLADPHYNPEKPEDAELREACESAVNWLENMRLTPGRKVLCNQLRKALGRTEV